MLEGRALGNGRSLLQDRLVCSQDILSQRLLLWRPGLARAQGRYMFERHRFGSRDGFKGHLSNRRWHRYRLRFRNWRSLDHRGHGRHRQVVGLLLDLASEEFPKVSRPQKAS